jgi:hypothetical protein
MFSMTLAFKRLFLKEKPRRNKAHQEKLFFPKDFTPQRFDPFSAIFLRVAEKSQFRAFFAPSTDQRCGHSRRSDEQSRGD